MTSNGTILELAERARKEICAQPVGFWVDPGAGSASDRFQHSEPSPAQYADMAKRGGHCETLYTGTSVEQMIIHVARALLSTQDKIREATIEECAKVAEQHADQCDDTVIGRRTNQTARDIAAAIRSIHPSPNRSDKPDHLPPSTLKAE